LPHRLGVERFSRIQVSWQLLHYKHTHEIHKVNKLAMTGKRNVHCMSLFIVMMYEIYFIILDQLNGKSSLIRLILNLSS
jgi:hypothetical protein